MSGLTELREWLSELSLLDAGDFIAWKPGPEPPITQHPPAGFRRHSTSQLPPSLSGSSAGGTPWTWNSPPAPTSGRYKTELCRPYQESNRCRYGDKCQFAHGLAELRPLHRHPKYKTEMCRTYQATGYCPYGSRCHFIHGPADARPRLLQSASYSGQASAGARPPLDWDALLAAFSPRLELELRQKLGLCPNCPPGSRPLGDRSPSAGSLSDADDSSGGSSGSESPVFERARRLPIFSRISVSE
ncbi:mRNA decay activator protein ZFP36-like [Narcine bancroftii]|uniref:mRNA decay activator protein ZFP36-like n=1 Tax=Narcine bancroftii TaxID=1343680 RepID=UPI00383145F7